MLVIMCCVLPVKYADNIYQLLPTGGTIPNEPCVLHEETPTNRYQDPCSRCETPWWFWFGGAQVYQCLPLRRSGSDPAAGLLYQAPPPGNEDGYYGLLYVLTVVGDEAIPIYFTFRVGRVVTGLCE